MNPGKAERRHLVTLAMVAAYVALTTVFLAADLFTYFGYIKANIVMMAIVIWVVLPVQHWRVPTRSKLSPLTSFLFMFGALMALRLLTAYYQKWADEWVMQLPGQTQNVLVDPMKAEVPHSIRSALDLAYSMVLAPVGEEFIYRFALLGSLAVFIKKPWALFVSTLVFVFVHFWGHTIIALVGITLLGFTLGLTYLTCGLGWSVLLHCLWNSFWIFQQSPQSQLFYLLFSALMPFGLWVFFSRLLRLRKTVFGG